MQSASRRILLYWFLLLVPTLVVGGLAIQLLRREQARLTAQGAYARESRQAAASARARLIVENVELLVGDVETGLLDTLAAEPAESLDEFMAQWEKANPLVRTAFYCTPDGQLLRPTQNQGDEDHRGFARRFGREFSGHPLWLTATSKTEDVANDMGVSAKEVGRLARKDIASNVAQVQSARQEVQALVKARSFAEAPAGQTSSNFSAADSSRSDSSDRNGFEADVVASEKRQVSREQRPASASNPIHQYAAQKKVSANEPPALLDSSASLGPPSRGWVAKTIDGRLHLIGWVRTAPTDNVRGVEAELAALISRLAGALPAELSGDEGYALLDEHGRVLHQVGAVARVGATTIRVPVATGLLPGWEVVAYLPEDMRTGSTGAGFFWVSGLLVGIFVLAILTAGQLLLRQARRSEAEAAQKTSFVANVSHEFKTPLTTIRLYAELLEQGRVRDAAQGDEYLRTIGRETQRLARLINNVLDFSRLEQGRKKFANDRLELTAELSRLLRTHAPRIAEAGLTLETNLPSSPVLATADRDALEQIVLNLVDNACKYASEGGTVLLAAAARTNGGAEVRVSDRGPGVAPEQRELIFEKFHRVDDSLRAEKTGAGLGLSIARQLARGMGGDLRYEPRAGGGSEFIVQLP